MRTEARQFPLSFRRELVEAFELYVNIKCRDSKETGYSDERTEVKMRYKEHVEIWEENEVREN